MLCSVTTADLSPGEVGGESDGARRQVALNDSEAFSEERLATIGLKRLRTVLTAIVDTGEPGAVDSERHHIIGIGTEVTFFVDYFNRYESHASPVSLQ